MKASGALLAAIATGSAIVATQATAQAGGDVKAGVDAWQAGDYARAVQLWQAPAAAGDPDACFNLAQAYKLGRGVPQDYGRAIQFYRQAAAKGHREAETKLGVILFQTGDRAGALPYLQRSADRGDPRAEYVLGTAMFNGDGVPLDYVKAYALMTRAAAGGLPQASASLAQMDGYLPAGTRQKGVALARRMGATAPAPHSPAPQLAAAAPPPPPPPAMRSAIAAPAPIATTTLPPSAPASSFASAPGASYSQPAAPLPATRPAAPRPAPAPAPAAGNGGWRVQFGAFGNPDKARSLWDGLHARYPALAGAQPYLVKAGAVTRLQAGPIASKAAADQLCAQTKAAGQDCIPVRQ